MNYNVNTEITITHLVYRKRQPVVAALGVTVGIAIFIFMNSLMKGFDRYSNESLFKTVPHLRIYKEDQIHQPLLAEGYLNTTPVVINPRIANQKKNLQNPAHLIEVLQRQPEVIAVAPEVTTNVFYNNGQSQINGMASGVDVIAEDAMFNVQASMVAGDFSDLRASPNNIVIAVGIAENLNLGLHENLTVTSSFGVVKVFKVVGLFKTGNRAMDRSKSYLNLAAAQQLLKEGPAHVTEIFVNVADADAAPRYVSRFETLTGYKVEDWQTASASAAATNNIRRIMALAISFSILLVASFGIYNILNMTVMQKLNDIAILKAMGFSGKDVVRIFLQEALLIGVLGVALGLAAGFVLVRVMSKVYVGGDIRYFPIGFEPIYFVLGIFFGLMVTFCAGYLPARKAAQVDPIAIFRK